MKILLAIPKHTRTSQVGLAAEKALKSLGHRVVVIDYYETVSDKIVKVVGRGKSDFKGINSRLKKQVIEYEPHLFLSIYGFYVNKETLSFIKQQNVVTACWWLNDPFQFGVGLDISDSYDFWFSNSSACVEYVRKEKQVKAKFLPAAIDPNVHAPVGVNSKYQCDVCFVGNWSVDREKVVAQIVSEAIDIKVYGDWHKKIAKTSALYPYLVASDLQPRQVVDYFCAAKLVLNFHTWHESHQHGVNRYLFEASGCGAAQVVDAKEELPTLYSPGEEVIVYQSVEDLPKVIIQSLKDQDKLKMIGSAARDRTLAEHTYTIRMQEMLVFMFG